MKFSPAEPVFAWAGKGASVVIGMTSVTEALANSLVEITHKSNGIVLCSDVFGNHWDCVWVLWDDGRRTLVEQRFLKSRLKR